ncbi:hypothetical protein, partial [Enterococcus faecalis]
MKLFYIKNKTTIIMSHPLRVRGLKWRKDVAYHELDQSHPLRVRGLKLADSLQYTTIRFVAPFAGAW